MSTRSLAEDEQGPSRSSSRCTAQPVANSSSVRPLVSPKRTGKLVRRWSSARETPPSLSRKNGSSAVAHTVAGDRPEEAEVGGEETQGDGMMMMGKNLLGRMKSQKGGAMSLSSIRGKWMKKFMKETKRVGSEIVDVDIPLEDQLPATDDRDKKKTKKKRARHSRIGYSEEEVLRRAELRRARERRIREELSLEYTDETSVTAAEDSDEHDEKVMAV